MMKFEELKKAMETANNMDELNALLKEAIKAFHPDNNIGNEEEVTEKFLLIKDIYTKNELRIKGFKPSKKLEKEVAKRNAILKIRRNFKTVAEFFSANGEEQLSVLKGMSARVAIVLNSTTPTPNDRQITDKHHADKNGNFDGMRSYAFVQFVFNKNHTINVERLEEVAQTAWIKLAENSTNEKYSELPFYSLLWISCRQAMRNLYYAEIKHDNYMDRNNDLYDLNAYETKVPTDSHTEANAMYNVWINGMFKDETDSIIYEMTKGGYTDIETGYAVGMSKQAVGKRLKGIHDRINKDRMLEAFNYKMPETRKNATAKEVVRILIMEAIKNGMSYKRIAYYLHCDVTDIPNMLKK